MNIDLYNLIVNGNYYTHSIGKIGDKDIFWKLELILKLQSLYSKETLRKLGINVEGRVAGNIRITKDSYVSLFDILNPSLRKKLLSPRFNQFFPIDNDNVVFLVDTSILEQKGAKRSDFDCHEIIVKDKIPFDYLFGLIVPRRDDIIENVNYLFQEYQIDIPLYDFQGKEIMMSRGR